MDNVQAKNAINGWFIERYPSAAAAALGPFSVDPPYRFATDNIVIPETDIGPDEYFARLSIISTNSEQRSIGPVPRDGREGRRTWLHEGIIEVRLSGPVAIGTETMEALARQVRRMFQGTRIGRSSREAGIRTEATEMPELRRDRERNHRWVVVCSTDFDFVEVG